MIELIPVYTHEIRVWLILEQQATNIFTLNSNKGKISVETKEKTKSYNLEKATIDKPIKILEAIKSVTYQADSSAIDEPILMQTWNGALIYIYPQTKILIDEQRDFNNPIKSTTQIETVWGKSAFKFHQNSGYMLVWSGIIELWETENNIYNLALAQYQSKFREDAKVLYDWDWSKSPVLEQISRMKIEFYQLFDPVKYSIILDNYLQYRYLVFGDKMPYVSSIEYIPLDKIQQRVLEQTEEVDPFQTVKDAASSGLWETRFLKELTW